MTPLTWLNLWENIFRKYVNESTEINFDNSNRIEYIRNLMDFTYGNQFYSKLSQMQFGRFSRWKHLYNILVLCLSVCWCWCCFIFLVQFAIKFKLSKYILFHFVCIQLNHFTTTDVRWEVGIHYDTIKSCALENI